jgi:succinate dehydrogenase / fumarate reductase flavoprotein subunit
MMHTYVGIARTEDDLRTALAELEKLRARSTRVGAQGNRQFNPGWHTALDLHFLLTVSEAVTRAALARRESRGAHTRVDHPDSDPTFGTKNVIVYLRNGAMTVREEPLPAVPDDLQRILESAG